jgi:signal transduction histidine kinase
MKKILYLVSILFSLQNYSFSQDQVIIDSLEALLKVHNLEKIEMQIKSPSMYDTTAANILNQIAKVYIGNNIDKAIDYANQSLSLSEQLGYKTGIGNAYNNLGSIFLSKPDYLASLEFYKKALKIREEAGNKKGIAYSYYNIAYVYRQLDNIPEALKNFFASLKIFEELGNKKDIANSYNSIGVIYHDQSNYPEALKNYFASLKIREEIGDKIGIAYCYNNIAIIYRNLRKYPEALKNSFASLKIKEEIGDKTGIANTYSNIGSIHYEQGNYPEALINHFAALKINEETGDKNSIGVDFLNIGLVKLKMNAAKEAKNWQIKGLQIGKAIESLSLMQLSYEGLTATDSALSNFKGAYENHKLFILYRDSINNTENAKKIIALQMNYDFGKKQDSLNVVQAKKDLIALKELNRQKLVRNGFIWGTIILLLMAGTAILFFIDRTKRNRMKQLEAVRGTISRDLHDDIGSTLQSISVMSEIALIKSRSGGSQESIPFLEKIGSASRDMMENMNDLVWAVNPQNDNFENIIYHMRAFGGELLAGKDIALHFKSDSDINTSLSMEERKSFFLVYKEALNNIYKYSGAKNVTVEISKTNHKLNLVVLDDGVGFNMNENHLKTGGNGLKNMNARASKLNGNISITSVPGKGTTVSLMVNLK